MSFLRRGVERLGTRKNIDRLLEEARDKQGLRKSLTARDLVTLGVAGIIGAGIFVLVGEGAEKAGVGVVFSFIMAAVICVFAGYAYAELSAAIPASGSAYAYLYTALGELPGWLVAWALILEYAVGAIAVAVGWRNNFVALYDQVRPDINAAWGTSLGALNPDWINSPFDEASAGILNVPAIAIVMLCTVMLAIGTKESARVTFLLVTMKVAILLLAIGVGFSLFEMDNLTSDPFPDDASGFIGSTQAVLAAAAIMFFAYIGFDSVSTTAEETRNPKKDLPIGILGSLGITTVLYILASLALVGAVDWHIFEGNSQDAVDARGEPFGYVFEEEGIGWAAILVRIGALIGTTSVLLVLILGGVRVFFNMSRDGLLPRWMSKVSPSRGNPLYTTLLYGGFTMLFAGLLTLGRAVELVNIGTLFAFLMVILGAWAFRVRRPDVERPFRMPMWSVINRGGRPYLPLFVLLGVVGILFLIFSLGEFTLWAFLTWTGLGLLVYALYGVRHSSEALTVFGSRDGALPAAAGAAAGEAALGAPMRGSGPAFTHQGYTLYARDVAAKDGSMRPMYFFAKQSPTSGSPVPMPPGYQVGTNPRTGLPFLRKAT